jgi:hypothetical protein
MRLPRVRFTVQRLMAAVAVVAGLLAGVPLLAKWVRVSLGYREMAAFCSKSEAAYRSYEQRYLTELQDFESGLRPRAELGFISGSPTGSESDFASEGATQCRAVAEHWARLKGAYVRASWLLWVDLPDSLRHPSWEGDMRPYVCGVY